MGDGFTTMRRSPGGDLVELETVENHEIADGDVRGLTGPSQQSINKWVKRGYCKLPFPELGVCVGSNAPNHE